MEALWRHPATSSVVGNFLSYSFWTLANKMIFGQCKDLPLLSTALQMVVVTAITITVQEVNGSPSGKGEKAPREVLTKMLIPLSLVRSCDLGFANLALAAMSVASQQILKSTIPVWVAVLTVAYLRQRVPLRAWVIVFIIVLGTIMATASDPDIAGRQNTILGVIFMLLSCFCRAGKCVINTRLLQALPGAGAQHKLHKLTLLRYEAPMSGTLLFLASMFCEIPYSTTLWEQPGYFMAATVCNGFLMFLNQVTYLAIVEYTSPIASQAIMNVKMIFLILLSTLFYPVHISFINGLGMMIAASSAIAYSYVADEKHKTREAINL
eukprot:TRINITY_DN47603_c0_g1_i1.p1 TRINITY_DN47603_c0_g1~~TRINITY_DN47603_c0_g1_i1.p1  ORF type:complete len:323 (+),score=80.29 TRINITY_DN47603_c0_g1_i1:33-1001(+)